jgi:hypothetical protein
MGLSVQPSKQPPPLQALLNRFVVPRGTSIPILPNEAWVFSWLLWAVTLRYVFLRVIP